MPIDDDNDLNSKLDIIREGLEEIGITGMLDIKIVDEADIPQGTPEEQFDDDAYNKYPESNYNPNNIN